MQGTLFPEMLQKKNDSIKMIGANLSLIFNRKNKHLVTLKKNDVVVKRADLSDLKFPIFLQRGAKTSVGTEMQIPNKYECL